MATKGLDMQSRRILEALLRTPGNRLEVVAADLGMAPDVVQARLDALQERGVITGFRAHVDAASLGMPHEVLVQGAPSAETTRDLLEGLAQHPGVTRVFALAARNSIAYTLRGSDPAKVQADALDLASRIGLLDPVATLIVDTIHDDPARGLGSALRLQSPPT